METLLDGIPVIGGGGSENSAEGQAADPARDLSLHHV